MIGRRVIGLWAVLALLIVPAVAQDAGAPGAGQPTEYMVAMRDGVKLATDVYLPPGPGPWPAILQRTPYNKNGGRRAAQRYNDAGYAFAIQDQRGKFRSEGVFTPHENELRDGYDAVEWAAAQPWCNGKVGMSGGSALGIAANLAAAADPPHLVCVHVNVAPQSLFYEGRFVGAIFKEADTGNWMRRNGVPEEEIAAYRKRVVLDERWADTDLIFHRHNIDVPIYNAGGWYDLFVMGNVSNFQYLQTWGREGARGRQKLMMGPIGHGPLSGDIEYPQSRLERDDELRFFDYWLKGVDTGIYRDPPVKYYMMAAARKGDPSPKNGWRSAETWPPNGVKTVRYYLRQGRGLSAEPPPKPTSSTTYTFDPAIPSPTVGGLNLTLERGPMDQREIGERPDYLRFQTDPLRRDLVLAGKVDLELWASSDAPDTDFIVKLVDVYPDGYEALILDTGLRARYRHGRRTEDVRLLTPGQPELLKIDLWHTAITIETGHRLAVHVTSGNSPRYEVNPNTGDPVGEEKSAPRAARNTIYHDAARPSAVLLPVLEE